GTFSYLPDLTDQQITSQIAYVLDQGWAVSIESTDDPHPRNVYWDMWGQPMFDVHDPAAVMDELRACRESVPQQYIKISAYDARLGRQTTALSFIVNRPDEEPGFTLERQEQSDRSVRYTLRSYAADKPHGHRYAP
ncbi:MAG TPA: ribulose bisphosphate carboxylase small subunit, partial [Chloroflexota bacterium]|nr:ribulose bisphosphate carboxylase small subunit [Chloroflexota bacterium]